MIHLAPTDSPLTYSNCLNISCNLRNNNRTQLGEMLLGWRGTSVEALANICMGLEIYLCVHRNLL